MGSACSSVIAPSLRNIPTKCAIVLPYRSDVRSVFFYVEVTTERLNAISLLLESARLIPQVGTILPLNDVRTAHEMLAGAPHKRGKIVLQVPR